MSVNPVSPARRRRNPWWVVIGGGVAGTVGPGPLILSTLGVFVIPITGETGFGRTTVTGAYSVAAVGMAIGLVVVGRMLDRYAVRHILVPSFVLFGAAVAAIAITPPVAPLFLLPFFFVGLFGAGTSIPFTKALVSWFDNKRALVIGITAGISGLGASITPILAGALIGSLGWRPAYAMLGLIAIVVSVTLIIGFVRARAERHVRGRLVTETIEDGREVSLELPGLTLREALRSRHFWLITLGLGLVGIVVVGLQVHLVPMMSDRGLDPAQAALLLTVFGLASLVGRVLGGFLIDRVHATVVGPIVILAPIVGMLFLHPPFGSAAAAVAFIGIAFGIEYDLLALLITRYLGMKAFGNLIGLINSVFLLGTAFGPLLLGIGYDTTGSYDAVIPFLIGTLVFCAILIVLLGGYRYPAVAGFDRVAAEDELAAAEILSDIAENEDEVSAHHGNRPGTTRSEALDPAAD